MTVKEYDTAAIAEIVLELMNAQEEQNENQPVAPWVEEITGIQDFDKFLNSELHSALMANSAGVSSAVVLKGVITTALLVGFKVGRGQAEAEQADKEGEPK